MIRAYLTILICCVSFSIWAQEKHALIIAIAQYPNDPAQNLNWSKLSSKNDADLLHQSLLKQGFKEDNIVVLLDSLATKKGILSAMHSIEKKRWPEM